MKIVYFHVKKEIIISSQYHSSMNRGKSTMSIDNMDTMNTEREDYIIHINSRMSDIVMIEKIHKLFRTGT